MNSRHHHLTILLTIILALVCTSCTQIQKLTKKDGPGQQQGTQGTTTQTPSVPQIGGDWQIAFQFGEQTFKANMRLQQEGNQFEGEGTDDPSGKVFNVEEGEINGAEVFFKKRYPGADPNSPAVEYLGKIEVVEDKDYKGPYMSGEYTTLVRGNPVKGIWEGQMPDKAVAAAPGPGAPPGQQPPPPPDPSRAPHLSGKWNVGYEYNFKTIKSVMYLEQEGGKVRGHGMDHNTKEKFTINKGWYNFPKLTLIREYVKGKGAAANRTMTFKAQVDNVNDKEYQGPYLSGKTEGGGAWEAQMYR